MTVIQTKKRNYSWWQRLVLPLAIITAWFVAGGVGGPYFGRIEEVSSNDLVTFLPKNAEATKVADELAKFQTGKTIPAIVVFATDQKLTDEQKTKIQDTQKALEKSSLSKGNVSAPVVSEDGKAVFMLVPLDSNSEFDKAIDSLKETIDSTNPAIDYKFAGPAMFARDLNKAFAGIDGKLLVVALVVVFVILLAVYRSPLLPVITLMGAMLALSASILLVWYLAKAGVVQLNGQVQGILFILVIGAATDYALLYISRYREELLHYESVWQATRATLKGSWEPIIAAGGTVSLGLMCLLASDLGSNKALGPVGAIGVVFSVLSALTFLPAALLLFGRSVFWPRRPKFVPGRKLTDYYDNHPVWSKVGEFVGKYPRRIWISVTVLLVLAVLYVPQLRADGVAQGDLVLGRSEAREGQALLDAHFPKGSGSPAYVIATSSNQQAVIDTLEAQPGVDTVSTANADSEGGPIPLGRMGQDIKEKIRTEISSTQNDQLAALREQLSTQMAGAPQVAVEQVYNQSVAQIPSVDTLVEQAYPFNDAKQKVVDGEVLLQATLKDPASSLEARQTIVQIREALSRRQLDARVGGVSAIQLDTNTSSERDLYVVIPLILAAITAVLMLLLRSIVAPLVLLLTTVLSFGTTLGVAALLFNHVWQYPGADPSVVIFGFVFLVALGIDYNIFLMTRVREETARIGVRTGTLKALVVTGGVITSAGIVLASTFAALYVIPILFLAQIAFIVAFGVLLDTVVVRSLLVPALTLEIGRPMWWPSKLAKKSK